jgi:hypothetical protein
MHHPGRQDARDGGRHVVHGHLNECDDVSGLLHKYQAHLSRADLSRNFGDPDELRMSYLFQLIVQIRKGFSGLFEGVRVRYVLEVEEHHNPRVVWQEDVLVRITNLLDSTVVINKRG